MSFNKILFLFAVVIICNCNIHLNVKYRDVLQGQIPLNQKLAQQIYSQFKSPHHQKSYYRFKIFYDSLSDIKQHNAGKHTWKKGINDFSDITYQQFKAQKLMAPQNCSATNKYRVSKLLKDKGVPQAYDWTNFGIVTPVKNQGDCGSCWTFSTVGAMESHWNLLRKGKNIIFSQQQILDCAWDFDNHGCHGGLPSHAFEYIKHVGGLETNLTYPYVGHETPCAYRKNIAVGYVKYGSYNITKGDQNQLAERLYNAGPISVAFESVDGLQDYVSGVFSDDNCGTTPDDVDHAVLAVGYGVQNGLKFWRIKNSWGPAWGNQGYFKLLRGANMCAIGQCNSYPLIDSLDGLEQIA